MKRNHLLFIPVLCLATIIGSAQNNTQFEPVTRAGSFSYFNALDNDWALEKRDPPGQDHTPLPLHWVSFEGLELRFSIVLRWVTTGELDVDYFEVESSLDNVQWNSVGRLAARLNPDALNTYSFEDKSNIRGVNYYRIRQVDNNHEVTYSRIVSVKKLERNRYYLWNDYASDFLIVVNADGEPIDSKVLVYDLNGRLILEVLPSISGFCIAGLWPGIYVLKTPHQSFKFFKY